MCIPPQAAIAGAGIGLSLLSSAQGARAQGQQDAATARRSQFEAQVARDNAAVQEIAARDVLARGEETAADTLVRGRIAESQQREETAQLIGVQRASLAGAGVEVDTGGALDLTLDTAGIGEFEAQTIRANAAREARATRINAERQAFAFRTQGTNFQSAALLAEARGRTPDRTAGNILGGATSAFSTFTSLKGARVI